ncbi:MAG: hypothetical protein RHS_2035 [Robinsoniella sp. RHS]|nr:MAG: hypothetical protein RHS_2035 [Robinsoniella sp. RHS]
MTSVLGQKCQLFYVQNLNGRDAMRKKAGKIIYPAQRKHRLKFQNSNKKIKIQERILC